LRRRISRALRKLLPRSHRLYHTSPWQATASAIATVVASPAELTPAAQEQALKLLGSIASQGDLVTAATANKVAAGLSGVIASVDLDTSRRRLQRRRLAQASGVEPAPVSADPRYLQIMNVVDGLAASLGKAMTVPGEEAVTIASSALQVRDCSSWQSSPLAELFGRAPGPPSSAILVICW
jgi:hypothetical protein